MFRKMIAGLFLLMMTIPLFSAEVSPELATRIARNFLLERSPTSLNRNFYTNTTFHPEPNYKGGELVYYFVEIPQNGFVLVSGDDNCTPILAYSFDPVHRDAEMPEACAVWFDWYADQVLYVKQQKSEASDGIRNQWRELNSETYNSTGISKNEGVGPLTISHWGQRYYYNNMCPVDPDGPGGHAIAGCVATALAQVLFYYRYPVHGEGSNGYMSNYGYEFVDFEEAEYKWDEMVNEIYGKNNPEIAELIYHAGVSVEMNYNSGSSGALTQETADALISYFKYSENLNYISLFDLGDAFKDSVFANLDQRRVMIYRGGGLGSSHSFVCDGYQDTSYLHFNWGWNGSFNGYFLMDNINPNVYNFTFDQGAVINIYPREDYPEYCQGNKTLTASRGTFTDGSGPDHYQENQSCSWLISPDESGITNIQFWLTQLQTEEEMDIVSVYDGATTSDPLLGQYSGEEIPPMLVSSGNEILIVFETDNAISDQGWQAEYLAYSGAFCNDLSQFNALSENYFTDASGPYHYIDLSDCGWLINPQDNSLDSISSVNLHFHWMALEQGDTLFVHDGANNTAPLLGKYYGLDIPDTIHSTGNLMYMNFISDELMNADGWAAGYTSNLPVYCNDTIPYTEKTGIISDGSGDKNYVSNTNCYWQIETENTELMTFEFLEFDIEYGYDQLKFYDASTTPPVLFATFWGHNLPPLITMHTDKVLISFVSDESVEFDGWKIKYSALAPGIDELSNPGRITLSPNPAHNKIVLEIASQLKEPVSYELFNVNMSMISKGTLNYPEGQTYELDVSVYQPGIYFILFQFKEYRTLHKLIIL